MDVNEVYKYTYYPVPRFPCSLSRLKKTQRDTDVSKRKIVEDAPNFPNSRTRILYDEETLEKVRAKKRKKEESRLINIRYEKRLQEKYNKPKKSPVEKKSLVDQKYEICKVCWYLSRSNELSKECSLNDYLWELTKVLEYSYLHLKMSSDKFIVRACNPNSLDTILDEIKYDEILESVKKREIPKALIGYINLNNVMFCSKHIIAKIEAMESESVKSTFVILKPPEDSSFVFPFLALANKDFVDKSMKVKESSAIPKPCAEKDEKSSQSEHSERLLNKDKTIQCFNKAVKRNFVYRDVSDEIRRVLCQRTMHKGYCVKAKLSKNFCETKSEFGKTAMDQLMGYGTHKNSDPYCTLELVEIFYFSTKKTVEKINLLDNLKQIDVNYLVPVFLKDSSIYYTREIEEKDDKEKIEFFEDFVPENGIDGLQYIQDKSCLDKSLYEFASKISDRFTKGLKIERRCKPKDNTTMDEVTFEKETLYVVEKWLDDGVESSSKESGMQTESKQQTSRRGFSESERSSSSSSSESAHPSSSGSSESVRPSSSSSSESVHPASSDSRESMHSMFEISSSDDESHGDNPFDGGRNLYSFTFRG